MNYYKYMYMYMYIHVHTLYMYLFVNVILLLLCITSSVCHCCVMSLQSYSFPLPPALTRRLPEIPTDVSHSTVCVTCVPAH